MDITKYELGDYITGLNCPKCKEKNKMRLVGLYHKQEKSHEVECLCFYSEKVNPKQVEFTYTDPEEKKRKKKGKNDKDNEEDFEEE